MKGDQSRPEKPKKKGKSKSKKKNCFLQTWGQFHSLSKCPQEVFNIDLGGNAIYNVFAGETHSFFFTMKNRLFGFGDDTFHQLTAEDHLKTPFARKSTDFVELDPNQEDLKKEDLEKEGVQQEVPTETPYFDCFYQFVPLSLGFGAKIEISKLVCGPGFSFCIDNFQAVYSWGLNNKGQLGQGHKNNLVRPTLIRTLVNADKHDNGSIAKTSTQGSFSTESYQPEVNTLGRLVSKYGLSKGEVVTDIACGGAHTLVVTSKNRVMSCGSGESGALGHKDAQEIESTFREVETLTNNLKKKFPQDIEGLEVQIKTGTTHSCCLVFNRLFVWGYFGDLELGQYSATPVEMNVNFEIADFECGDLLTVFLSTTGEVFTIGNWKNGVLGVSHEKIKKYFTSLVREKTGKTLQNSKSQSAFNRKRSVSRGGRKTRTSTKKEIFTPIEIKLPCKISQIAVGNRHVFALNQHAGKIYAWGDNSWQQVMPYSKLKSIWEPVRVEFLNECGSFVILCRGNNSYLISRKLIRGTDIQRNLSFEDKLVAKRNEYKELENKCKELKTEATNLGNLKKELKIKLKRKNTKLEKLRMITRKEDFVEESAISIEPAENDYKWEINKIIRSFKKELSEDRTLKPHCEIDFGELELLSQISEGGFGLIFKAKWRDSIVAVKVMKQELMKKELIKDFLSKSNKMSVMLWRVSDIQILFCSWGHAPNSLIFPLCWNSAHIRVSGICYITRNSTYLGKNEEE